VPIIGGSGAYYRGFLLAHNLPVKCNHRKSSFECVNKSSVEFGIDPGGRRRAVGPAQLAPAGRELPIPAPGGLVYRCVPSVHVDGAAQGGGATGCSAERGGARGGAPRGGAPRGGCLRGGAPRVGAPRGGRRASKATPLGAAPGGLPLSVPPGARKPHPQRRLYPLYWATDPPMMGNLAPYSGQFPPLL